MGADHGGPWGAVGVGSSGRVTGCNGEGLTAGDWTSRAWGGDSRWTWEVTSKKVEWWALSGRQCDLRPLSSTAPPAWAASRTEKTLRRRRTQVRVRPRAVAGLGVE